MPVLVHGKKKLTQSAVILTYLAEKSGKFLPKGDDERLEALRWIVFDNQKVNGFLGPYRFLKNWAPKSDPAVMEFLKGRVRTRSASWTSGFRRDPFLVGRAADDRGRFAGGIFLLSGRGVRLRRGGRTAAYRRLARAHPRAAGLGASL